MGKINIAKWNQVYPLLPVFVGADVERKPNYITIGYFSSLSHEVVSVSIGREQYTNSGIRENRTFSINQPSTSMVRKLDYYGIFSGSKINKSSLFDNFYGGLKTTPMIKECPINVECNVIQTIDMTGYSVFIGEVNDMYIDEECLTDGMLDMNKIDPVLFNADVEIENKQLKIPNRYSGRYWKLGEYPGQAWEIGKEMKL